MNHLQKYRVINDILSKKAIDYVFIKVGSPGRDVDLLIEKNLDRKVAIEALKSSGYKEKKQNQPYRVSLIKDLEVDLHSKISWGGLVFLEGVEKQMNLGFPAPVPQDEFLINSAHLIFSRPKIHPEEVRKLLEDLERLDLEVMLKKSEEFGWKEALQKFVEDAKEVSKASEAYKIRFRYLLFVMEKMIFDFKKRRIGAIREIFSYVRWRFSSWT